MQLSLKPDGSWERHEYDANGWLTRIVRPLTNQPPTASTNDCRVTEYGYASVSGSYDTPSTQEGKPRTIYELVRSQVVSKTMYAFSGNNTYMRAAGSATAGWTDADNEVSYSYEDYEHRIIEAGNPDGTRYTVAFTDDSSGRLTTTHYYDAASTEYRTTEEQVNTLGRMVSRKTFEIGASTILVDQQLYSDNDEFLHPTKVTYLDDTSTVTVKQDCCNAAYTIDRDGIATTNSYDAVKRLVTSTRARLWFSR